MHLCTCLGAWATRGLERNGALQRNFELVYQSAQPACGVQTNVLQEKAQFPTSLSSVIKMLTSR